MPHRSPGSGGRLVPDRVGSPHWRAVALSSPPQFDDLTGPEPSTRRRRVRIGKAAAIVTCVFIVGMWGFVYIWGAVQKPVDKLASPDFGRRGEPVCAVTAAQLAALPPAQSSKTNVDRAAVVARSNVDLRTMLAGLAKVAPTSGKDARIVREWLADYSTYVGNREDYARRLATDPAARFYENQKEPGEQISDPIDTFATANGMNDCVAPEDLS